VWTIGKVQYKEMERGWWVVMFRKENKSNVSICFDCFPKGKFDSNESDSNSVSSEDSSSSDDSTQPLVETIV
jgi:hypothetical protein